jgi:bacteriorhodopsin
MAPPERRATEGRSRRARWYWLLLAPYAGMLWVPLYNRIEPRAGSIPFFYWYQFAWIGISAALTALVYFVTRQPRDASERDR